MSSRARSQDLHSLTRRSLAGTLAGAGVFAALPAWAAGSGKVALVVAVSKYDNAVRLPNTASDAQLISGALQRLGFEVTTVTDPTRQEFLSALEAFKRRAAGSDAALVYYAGHGAEIAGVNYLLPRDVSSRGAQLVGSSLQASKVRECVLPAQRVRLVVLDACRNAPEGMKASDVKIGLGRETGGSTAEVVTLMAAAPGQARSGRVRRQQPLRAGLGRRPEAAGHHRGRAAAHRAGGRPAGHQEPAGPRPAGHLDRHLLELRRQGRRDRPGPGPGAHQARAGLLAGDQELRGARGLPGLYRGQRPG